MTKPTKQGALSVAAMAVSLAVGASTLLGIPKCYEMQTKAEAATVKAGLESKIDKLEAKVDKVIDLLMKEKR